jgi:hypothetical protein
MKITRLDQTEIDTEKLPDKEAEIYEVLARLKKYARDTMSRCSAGSSSMKDGIAADKLWVTGTRSISSFSWNF